MYRVCVIDSDGVEFQFQGPVFSLGETDAVVEAAEYEYPADDGYSVSVQNLTPNDKNPNLSEWVEVD